MGQYLDCNTGFVLWIVPNEAIYSQTLRHLKDRQHPYRQALDRTAAGRVRVMEKTDRLDVRDVETNLCVMLLMLQSANRQTQDSLKPDPLPQAVWINPPVTPTTGETAQ